MADTSPSPDADTTFAQRLRRWFNVDLVSGHDIDLADMSWIMLLRKVNYIIQVMS